MAETSVILSALTMGWNKGNVFTKITLCVCFSQLQQERRDAELRAKREEEEQRKRREEKRRQQEEQKRREEEELLRRKQVASN